MKKSLLGILILLAIILTSCGNEKKDMYNKAIEQVKSRLKAPSSAKFESYDEKYITILDSAGTGNPFKESMGYDMYFKLSPEVIKKNDEQNNDVYGFAGVEINYEAQNSFGVFIKDTKTIFFKKWHFNDKTVGEWQLIKD